MSLPSISLAFYFGSAALGGCAQPIAGLWPAAEGERTYRMVVSIDRWHSVIGIWPLDDADGVDPSGLQEWGYAEKGYYLDGDDGCSGTMRALFVPSDGVVQSSRAGRPWSERTHQGPARLWTFRLTEAGHRALAAMFAAERASDEPIKVDAATWYPSTHSYHFFHNCHVWTARCLRAAGLPVWSCYAPFKWSLEAQLDRAVTFVDDGDDERGGAGD